MRDNCRLCEKGVSSSSEWKMVRGILLRPLCSECSRLCATKPDQVVMSYPWLFNPEIPKPLGPSVVANNASGNVAPQSRQISVLMGRYTDAYVVARVTNGFGG